MSVYSHYPLDGESDIRLLVLHPASHLDDAIVCDLVVASLGTKPYTALSYTWGPPFEGAPSEDHSITLCHSSFTVKENLFQALQHLRDKETPFFLWVDAICINQKDDVERSQQVACMGDIYRSADQVYAWLGVESANYDGTITFKFFELAASIKRYEECRFIKQSPSVLSLSDDSAIWSIEKRLKQANASDTPNLAHIFPEMNNPKHDLGAFMVGKTSFSPSLSSALSDPKEMVEQAFQTFRRRNYFFRRWVVQEIFLAQKATLLCGNSRIEWSVLVDAHKSLLELQRAAIGNYGPGALYNLVKKLHVGHLPSLLGALLRFRFDEECQDPTRLFELVRRFTWAECADPRDRIYSLISLFPVPALQPDYRLSADIVYTQFARAAIENGGVVRLLCLLKALFEVKAYCDHVFQKVQSLSSWVPDWVFPNIHELIQRSVWMKQGFLWKHVAGYVENARIVHDNILSCKLLKCCKVLDARKPQLPCSNPDASCRRSWPGHPPEGYPSHRSQFLRIGQPEKQSSDHLPREDETAEMEPKVYEGEIKAGDIICCLISQKSLEPGSTDLDRDARFVILRRIDHNPNAYRFAGTCVQDLGAGFDRVAGPLEVKIG